MNENLKMVPAEQFATKTIENLNVLTVGAGTNCPCGGDSGYGGLTILLFENDASTDMRIELDGITYDNINKVQLIFGGDSECETVIQGLRFQLDQLEKQLNNNGNHSYLHESAI